MTIKQSVNNGRVGAAPPKKFVKRRCLHVIVKRELETHKLILIGVWESGSGDPAGGTARLQIAARSFPTGRRLAAVV